MNSDEKILLALDTLSSKVDTLSSKVDKNRAELSREAKINLDAVLFEIERAELRILRHIKEKALSPAGLAAKDKLEIM